MSRDLFNYTYVLPSEPTGIGPGFAEEMKIFGVAMGSFVVTAIVAGLIVAGLLWLTRRPNFTDDERDTRERIGIVSELLVYLVVAVAIPVWLYEDEASPQPPTPKETYMGISDALRDRDSTYFHFRLDDELSAEPMSSTSSTLPSPATGTPWCHCAWSRRNATPGSTSPDGNRWSGSTDVSHKKIPI